MGGVFSNGQRMQAGLVVADASPTKGGSVREEEAEEEEEKKGGRGKRRRQK